MGAGAILAFILQYGPAAVGLAERIWTIWTSGKDPTPDDWTALKALASQTALTQMQQALTRAGIPLDSPQALALLALVK